MATRAELEKQLATIQAGLLDFTDVGEASYFKQTGATKLAEKEVPRYTDVYNPALEKIKDIEFTVASDTQTRTTGDTAFYVFNPEIEAKKRTEATIEAVEKNNLAVIKQQEDIKKFLASEKETAKESILQNYLSSILNPTLRPGQSNPFEYETVDINTAEGWNRWRNTPRNKQSYNRYWDNVNRRYTYTYQIKLTPAEVEEKKKTTEAIERMRFMSSPTLQKTYADIYAKTLQSSIKTMLDNERKAETKTQKIQKKIEKLQSKLPK